MNNKPIKKNKDMKNKKEAKKEKGAPEQKKEQDEDLSHLKAIEVDDFDEYNKAHGYIPLEQVLKEISEKYGI